MKHLFTIVLAIVSLALAGCEAKAGYEDEVVVTQEVQSFDPDVDYIREWLRCAIKPPKYHCHSVRSQ